MLVLLAKIALSVSAVLVYIYTQDAYVCVDKVMIIVKCFAFVFERFLAPCFIELMMLYC